MFKRIVLVFFSIFCISLSTYGVDAWIRINQLGYLPNSLKRAVLISESPLTIKDFTLYDALTNQELGTFKTVTSRGEFENFNSTYILDFSSFKHQGAFYILAGSVYSPTIYINKYIYTGTADFLLNYIRMQRNGYDPDLKPDDHQLNTYEATGENISEPAEPEKTENQIDFSSIYKKNRHKSRYSKKTEEIEFPKTPEFKYVDVRGGWHDANNFAQYGITSSTATYQLLFAYQMNPTSFADKYDAKGYNTPNGIPDILDEAKWGLDWLLKMYPEKDVLYHQIGDDTEESDIDDNQGTERPVYLATGRPQGTNTIKNQSTGIASIAGKYSSAFSLGADLMSKYYPAYADSLKEKSIEAYEFGKENPGACQSVPAKTTDYYKEENWSDDMELAAAQLYHLTYDGNFLKDAVEFGRKEPISPWMCSDSARLYQWYPFINFGHYVLANVENPVYHKEFLQDMLDGIHRMSIAAADNPFNVGVPMIWGSNSMVTALATQCRLYRTLTNDSTYLNLETSLVDWLLGCNPWGTSMIIGMPEDGIFPTDPHADLSHYIHIPLSGGMINGPVSSIVFKNAKGIKLTKEDKYDQLQSDWAVYHDDYADYDTNEPTIDGTAELTYLLSSKQTEESPDSSPDANQYTYGAITQTDKTKKQISLVFVGDEFSDEAKAILNTLEKLKIKASFFFTGRFYRDPKNKQIINELQKEKFYLGAHSDKNTLYCSLQNRDSMLIHKPDFMNDLKANFMEMEKFGITKDKAPFFIPPKEWYNEKISQWCKEIGLQLVSYTPETLSYADITTPDMRDKYFSSNEISNRILEIESKQGLNGSILLFHVGADKRRKDKFYTHLEPLLMELTKLGYEFSDLYESTNIIDKKVVVIEKNKKRKN
ncbi:MAG: glycoside hydrolase family 9 protein [Paludibacter sp.]|nr:glycoside hydrolase family 9 protein [Paludibacter sp.]